MAERAYNDEGTIIERQSDGTWKVVDDPPSQFWRTLLGQGLALGFGDEIEAGIRSVGSDRSYRDIRDEIRAGLDAWRETSPVSYYGTELGGGMLTGGIGAGRAATAAGGRSLLRNVGSATGRGVTEGAIAGAGQAEELSDLPVGMTTGGLVGGALGAGGGILEAAARNMAARTPRGMAANKVQDMLGRRGIETPAQLDTALNQLGPGGRVADLGDEAAAMARAAYMRDLPGRNLNEEVLRARYRNQLPAIDQQFAAVTGGRTPRQARTEMQDIKRIEASPEYTRAMSMPVNPQAMDPDLFQANISTPDAQSALRGARIRYMNRFPGQTVDIDSPESITDLRFWNLFKQEMDKKIRPGSGRGAESPGAASEINRVFRDLWDEQTGQQYALARQKWRQPQLVEEAIQDGARIFQRKVGETTEDMVAAINDMTAEQKRGYIIGALGEMKEKVMRRSPEGNYARGLLRDQSVQEKLRAAFDGTDTEFDEFIGGLENLADQVGLATYILQGSRTGPVMQEAAAMASPVNVTQALSDPSTIPGMAMSAISDSLNESMSNRQAGEMAGYLLRNEGVEDIFRRGSLNPMMSYTLTQGAPGAVTNTLMDYLMSNQQ